MTKQHSPDIVYEEKKMIHNIVKRAVKESEYKFSRNQIKTIETSLWHCHLDRPLDLKKLYNFDRFSLLHDVFGIDKHMSRRTKKLEGCFLPRSTLKGEKL